MSTQLQINISEDKSKIEIYDPKTKIGQVITGTVDSQTMGNIIADYINFLDSNKNISEEEGEEK